LQPPGKLAVNPVDSASPVDDPADPAPRHPSEPDAADCCGEGCARCVYDIHEEALERYRRAQDAWRARHPDS
jgi:hypothetical protein